MNFTAYIARRAFSLKILYELQPTYPKYLTACDPAHPVFIRLR